MNEKDKKEFINLFNQGFEEVVIPVIEGVRGEVKEVKQVLNEHTRTLEDHSNRFERIERKLDAVVERQDDQGTEIKKIKQTGQSQQKEITKIKTALKVS